MDNSCENEVMTPTPQLYLWSIVYTIHESNGIAVVKAIDAAQAEKILKAGSQYNGYAKDFHIQSIIQITEGNTEALIAELYNITPIVL